MKILCVYRQAHRNDRPVESYARSCVYYLRQMGHAADTAGPGHEHAHPKDVPGLRDYDLLLEIETGREPNGTLRFYVAEIDRSERPLSAIWLIDSHGYASLHKRMAAEYDKVFFAVYSKREIFRNLNSCWLPNATDPRFFDYKNLPDTEIEFDFGFFGSKRGLVRANYMIELCNVRGWSCQVREVVKRDRHRWPATGIAMRGCHVLFNQGQRQDGPNQRVLESMAVGRPLISDYDPASGMVNLFTAGQHYIAYTKHDKDSLEDAMEYLISYEEERERIAENAYNEVMSKHLIPHRMKRLLSKL